MQGQRNVRVEETWGELAPDEHRFTVWRNAQLIAVVATPCDCEVAVLEPHVISSPPSPKPSDKALCAKCGGWARRQDAYCGDEKPSGKSGELCGRCQAKIH